MIRSWDEELFKPTTYFINLIVDLDDDDDDQSFVYSNFLDDLPNVLPEDIKITFRNQYRNQKSIDELSGEFRGSAIVLAETDSTLLLTTTDSDNFHLAIGCVPNFKMEDIEEEAWEVIDSDWYDRRDRLDLHEKKREEYSKKEYNKKFKTFHKEAKQMLTELHKTYQLSARNGAWMSRQVEPNKIIEP